MDKFILKLYEKNIIQLKKTNLKNGIEKKIHIKLSNIFEDNDILKTMITLMYNKIESLCFLFEYIYGYKEISSYISILLSFKYNYNNILHQNIKDIDYEKKNLLVIKENNVNSNNFLKTMELLNNKNINNLYIFSLINNSNIHNDNYIYLLDEHEIIYTLYLNNIINYERYLDVHLNLSSHINTFKSFKINNSEILNIINKKKTIIAFSDNIIKNVNIKEFIKLLDFVGKHIVFLILTKSYSIIEYSSIQKLSKHHNFILIDSNNINNSNNNKQIKILNSETIFTNTLNTSENNLYLMLNTLTKKFNNLYTHINQSVNTNSNIIGIITNTFIPYTKKINIFLQKNNISTEDILLKYNYDMIITENPQNVVSLKQCSWNIHTKKYNISQ